MEHASRSKLLWHHGGLSWVIMSMLLECQIGLLELVLAAISAKTKHIFALDLSSSSELKVEQNLKHMW